MTALHWVIVVQFVFGWAGAILWRNRGYRRGVSKGLEMAQQIALNESYRAPGAAGMGPEQNCVRVYHSIRIAGREWDRKKA